jgi:transcriptional regulator with XRE-family HTH domain
MTQQKIADIFGVEQQSVSNWIKDIRAGQKGSRENMIYRLDFLGWTQQEIADVVKLERSSISKNVNSGNFSKIHNDIDSGKSISEIAEFHGLDIPVAWAIVLDEKTDSERFEMFGTSKYGNEKPKPFNVWSFANRDTRLGK